MKICAYVQDCYAKTTYKNECMDIRQFVGLWVIIDALTRAGYPVEWAGRATVHNYDIVLVSLTSDCDWWSYISERLTWQRGNYKVIIGGAGVLHITPFLPFGDYFSFGRGEKTVVELVRALDGKGDITSDSIADAETFDPSRIYHIEQTDELYPHCITLLADKQKSFQESAIGCNHRCLFCGYSWHRKFISPNNYYSIDTGLFVDMGSKERAMLDIQRDPDSVDFSKLRTTAIDGMSERLRVMINKKITRAAVVDFLRRMVNSPAKPHQLKLYNIVGYPTETIDDWHELMDALREADGTTKIKDKQWSIVLHSTPFRPLPATPMACAPMSKRNYRGEIGRILGKGLKGNIIYQGANLWSVESMGTDSLPTVMLSALAHRGDKADTENIAKLCSTPRFWGASSAVKEATLSKYFDMDALFGEYTAETLPSRYLRTYARVETFWNCPPWRQHSNATNAEAK